MEIENDLSPYKEIVFRTRWLVKLRWIAGGAVLLTSLGARFILKIPIPLIPFLTLSSAILLYNLICAWYTHHLIKLKPGLYSFHNFANFQITGDWLFLILLVHYSGGIESPLIFYFVFHIIISAFLLSRRSLFFQSFLASGLILSLTLLEYTHTLPHYHLFEVHSITGFFYNRPSVFSIYLFFIISCFFITAYLGGSISKALRERERQLKKKSIQDELTGLYSRQYFSARAREEMARASRDKSCVSFLFCDIDDFKAINRIKGYPEGDRLLLEAAKTLRHSLREDDVVCRYGGDEFAVLLPRTDTSGATKMAERVNEVLKKENHLQGSSSLSLSIGIASYPVHGSSLEEIMAKADRGMVFAKYHPEKKISCWREWEIKDIEKVYKKEVVPQLIYALTEIVDIKDGYTGEHSKLVARQALELAERIRIKDKNMLERIKVSALLHDIGKLTTPTNILTKPGPLTDEEWEIIKDHSKSGASLAVKVLSEVAPIIKAIHERWNGKGYPDGLAGDKIPIEARIIALVDAYQALVSDRPYRKRLSKQEAKQVLKDEAGKQFDPELVKAFLEIVEGR